MLNHGHNMKKVSILLIISMFTSLLFSCGGATDNDVNVPTRELLDGVISLFDPDTHHDPVIYYSGAEKGSDNFLDEGNMNLYFYGDYDKENSALPLIDEYAFALPIGLYAFEIDIIKAKSIEDVNEIKTFINSRYEQKLKTRGELQYYDSAQIPVLDNCEVYTSGKYVFLIATPDNAAVKAKINEMFGTGKLDLSDNTETDTSVIKDGITDIVSSINSNIAGGGNKPVTTAPTELDPSELPVLTITSYSANNLVILGGTCEKGAKIHVRGGVKDWVFETDYTNWMCEVEIPMNEVITLYLTQEAPNMAESEPISITVQSRNDVNLSSHGVCQVAIGDKAQGHFFGQIADWCGTNIMSDNQATNVTERIKEKVDYLDGRDCELIYVIVPNPMAVYPETVPERYEKSTAKTSRTEQFENAAREAGATVVDLTDIFDKYKYDEYKIYHKTDSHWTDFGAFLGYTDLMDYISETWEDAKPLKINDAFEFYQKEIIGGDMLTHLEIQNSLMREYTTFVKWNIEAVSNPNIYMSGKNELDFNPVNKTITVKNNVSEGDLPTAMIIRDSFSTNIYGYMNNAFSEVYWQSMWNYKFDKSYIEKTNPDYYIILVAERNIGNILG